MARYSLSVASWKVARGIPLSSTTALSNRAISVTATDTQGNTSELSNCETYVCDEIFGYGFELGPAQTCPLP